MRKIEIYTLSDKNGIRYVGKSNNTDKRYYRHIFDAKTKKKLNKRDAWIKSLLNKNMKPILEVIDVVDESEWILMEKYWISQFKTWGFELKNMTDGGDGLYGLKHSVKTKKKMSETKKGKTPKNINFLHQSSIKGKIFQYDLNGKKIKEWESVNNAKKKLNITNIDLVIKRKRSSAGGYIWRYKTEPLTNEELDIIKEKHDKQKPKKVIQKTLKGEFVKEWGSVNEIKKIYKHINSVLRGDRKTAGGYLWLYTI